MLTIRLTRKGKKNQPFFRIVVVDKRRSAKGGRAVEVLGYMDPLTKRKSLKKERILYWISKGAQPSATMHNLLVSEKIIDAKKIAKHKMKPRSEAAAPTTGEPKNPPLPKTQEGQAQPEAAPDSEVSAQSTEAPLQPAENPKEPVKEEKPAEAMKAEEKLES